MGESFATLPSYRGAERSAAPGSGTVADVRSGCHAHLFATIVRRGIRGTVTMPPISRCLVATLSLLLPGCVFITGNLNPFAATPAPLEEHVVSGDGKAKI